MWLAALEELAGGISDTRQYDTDRLSYISI